jgi:glucokinase
MRAIGIDIGGSKLLACLTDGSGHLLGRATRPTGRGTGPKDALRCILAAADELRLAHGPFDVAGVGFPGQVDWGRGVARASVMLDGWREVPLAEQVGDALGVPCVVDNDVNAAAVAELEQRRGETISSMLFVAVGTGIGGAIVLDNRLWRGHTGVAGEIGNVTIDRHGSICWCGRRGCLNTCASGAAIERELDSGVPLDGQAELGPVIEGAADALGIGIANALNLLNPGLVVLGGGVARLGQPWLERVAKTARSEAFPEAGMCRFELARAGYDAGAVGAALLGLAELQRTSGFTTSAPPAVPEAAEARDGRVLSGAPRSGR